MKTTKKLWKYEWRERECVCHASVSSHTSVHFYIRQMRRSYFFFGQRASAAVRERVLVHRQQLRKGLRLHFGFKQIAFKLL